MPDRQPVPEPIDVVKNLRSKVLSMSPANLGLSPSQQLPNVWGIIMEMGYTETLASLVVLADGTTSLCLGYGGGFIGGGEYASVRTASARFLSVADHYHAGLQSAHTFPYPDVGRVKFYVLTFSGVLFADADEKELVQKAHRLADLFYAGHGVLTELRLIEQGGTAIDDTA
jgi:hypothetical protein